MESTYFVSTLASTAGASKRHLAIFNASGSGKILKVYRVIASGAPTAAVTGLVIPLTIGRITTVPTGGTNPTICKADTTNNNVPGQITAHAAATGGATEEASVFVTGTISGEESSQGQTALMYESIINGTQPITCREGEGILIKQGALASAGALNACIIFSLV